MDINTVLTAILIAVFILVGVALVAFLLQMVKLLKGVQVAIEKVEPTLENVETITRDIQPAINKVGPLMDRVQLTVDSLNLEMMRVDRILENVSEITESASSAAGAVDNIASAPMKAANGVANRMKTYFGGKSASQESAQLAEQRVAVAQALKDYEAAEEKEAKRAAKQAARAERESTPELKPAAQAQPAVQSAAKPDVAEETKAPAPAAGEKLETYVNMAEGEELEIDPKVIAESPFFNDDAK